MELNDYIRVLRRRLGWFVLVMGAILGGYVVTSLSNQEKVFAARAELYIVTSPTLSIFEGVVHYFPNVSKMSPETRLQTLKTKAVAELAALYLCDAKAVPDGDYLFAAERKEADGKTEGFRDNLIALYRERYPDLSRSEILEAHGQEIEHTLKARRTLDPETRRWEGKMGKWEEFCVKAIAARIQDTFAITWDEKTQIITIVARQDSPARVVAATNAFCEAAIRYNQALDNREIAECSAKALVKIEENQQRLDAARSDLKDYWKRHQISDSDYYTSALFYQQIASFQADIDRLNGELLKKDEEQAKIDARQELERDQFPEFVLPPDSPLGRALDQAASAEKDLEFLLMKYTEDHPEVKRAHRTIEELKVQYQFEARKFKEHESRNSRRDKALLDLEKRFIHQEIARKGALLDTLRAKRTEVDQLRLGEQKMQTTIQRLEEDNNRLTNFIAVASLYHDRSSLSVDRFSDRLDPESGFWEESQDLWQMLWFVSVIALLVSLGVVFLVEYMDTTLKTEQDVRRHLNIPVLGVISRQKKDASVLITELPTKHAFTEEFSTTASLLLAAAKAQTDPCKTLAICSSIPREGKTTITVNLGISLARQGFRVLLVDSDMRIPRLHEIFGLSNHLGLSSVLEGRLRARKILSDIQVFAKEGKGPEAGPGMPPGGPEPTCVEDCLQQIPEEGVRVLTSGPIPPDPARLLRSAIMPTLISDLKGLADFVLFDTPPLTSVGDALIFSQHIDAHIFVVGTGTVAQHQATRAKHLLASVEAVIMGCVLNLASIDGQSYYYYYNEHKSYRARG